MKTKIINGLIILIFVILLLEVFFNKMLVFDTISYSLSLWVNTLIPTMFPFFVISDILISYHITNYIPKFIKKTLGKLFGVSDAIVTIFLLSCISGFPSNARNTKIFYEHNYITKKEAEHALLFTHFSNPLFILSTVGVFFFHNEFYGYLILVSHVLGNIIIGIITRRTSISPNNYYTPLDIKSQSFSTVFISAIKSAIDTLLTILGTLTCFLIVSSFIIKNLNMNPYLSSIIKGILEITMGIKSLSDCGIPIVYQIVITTMFLSFGGFSVHLQVLSQLVDTDISYQPFFVARVFHAILSGIICYLFFILLC